MVPFNWLKRLDEIWIRNGQYIEPLSENWVQARRGRLTASGAAHIIAKWSPKGLTTLRNKLMAQMETTFVWTELSLPQLDWGREHEKAAIATIELTLGVDMPEPGTVFHPEFPYCSSTPDGLIDGHISVQIKCPHKRSIHLDYFYNKPILQVGPKGGRMNYFWQTQWEAFTSGADTILFASFDPEQPPATRLGICEVPVDAEVQELFATNAVRFRRFMETGVLPQAGRATPIGIPNLF